jgi:hypothetical protein
MNANWVDSIVFGEAWKMGYTLASTKNCEVAGRSVILEVESRAPVRAIAVDLFRSWHISTASSPGVKEARAALCCTRCE